MSIDKLNALLGSESENRNFYISVAKYMLTVDIFLIGNEHIVNCCMEKFHFQEMSFEYTDKSAKVSFIDEDGNEDGFEFKAGLKKDEYESSRSSLNIYDTHIKLID